MADSGAAGDARPKGHGVAFRDALGVWLRIGLVSFGGPAGQIALMHRVLVEERRWISESRFLHALNYCMLLPGPEAQQLATYVGWLLHRTAGGLAAGLLFILPGACVILGLSLLYVAFQDLPLVQAVFYGIKAAVLAVVIEAALRIGRRALASGAMIALAGLAFVAIFFLAVPFPVIVIGAGLIGLLGGALAPAQFVKARRETESGDGPVLDAALGEGQLAHTRPSAGRALRTLAVWLPLWFAPLLLLAAGLGWSHVFTEQAAFFSKMAVVTFGGAYAVLAYVAQEAVGTYAWLSPGEMLDGLGLAETTPGPLILVLQFVGFLGAFRNPGALDPMLAGTLGALVTLWVTFTPCFLWIFLGAPYIEALRGRRALEAALSAITAAVVGVILNLAIWFALHVLFAEVEEVTVAQVLRLYVPEWSGLDPFAALLAAGAMLAMIRFKLGMIPTLLACALAGVLWRSLAA